jgi:predicted DsbA family dithiol-disulfide isomerase
MSDVLKVAAWIDVACPWCYLGTRRFAEGVRQYHEAGGIREIELEYHSMQMAADTPLDFEGSETDFLVRHREMTPDAADSMLARMTDVAAGEGLTIRYDLLRHANTRLAHELLQLAKEHGQRAQMQERLLAAYFAEGRHIGRIDELADLAAEVGLSPTTVTDALTDGTYAAALDADIALAKPYGVRNLPFFLIGSNYGLSGGYGPEVYTETINKVLAQPK